MPDVPPYRPVADTHRWGPTELVGLADALTECRDCGTYLGSAASDRPCPSAQTDPT